MIKENLASVEERIAGAAQRAGRRREDVLLIGVTKTIDPARINEAVAAGLTDIGENRVQEVLEKYEAVQSVNWHLIGHLQTNKVKYIVDKACLIHSVDSLRLAEEISKTAKKQGLTAKILLEVNISGEESKFGLTIQEIPYIIDKIEELDCLQVQGLMTVAPASADPQAVRPVFRQLYGLFDRLGQEHYRHTSMEYLSMGMSGDFEVAIEEGANMVRVGSAIFGKRNYAI